MRDTSAAHSAERVHRSLERIVEQHAKILSLRRVVEGALGRSDTAAVRESLQQLAGTIEAHFELEECSYYPAGIPVENPVADTLQSFIEEHERLRTELQTLGSLLAAERSEDFKRAFDAFCSTLADHEAREEKAMSDLAGMR